MMSTPSLCHPTAIFTDLRNTNEISEICHEKNEPIFITKNGYGDLVIMSIETYEQVLEVIEIDAAIAEAESEYKRVGDLLDANEVLDSKEEAF